MPTLGEFGHPDQDTHGLRRLRARRCEARPLCSRPRWANFRCRQRIFVLRFRAKLVRIESARRAREYQCSSRGCRALERPITAVRFMIRCSSNSAMKVPLSICPRKAPADRRARSNICRFECRLTDKRKGPAQGLSMHRGCRSTDVFQAAAASNSQSLGMMTASMTCMTPFDVLISRCLTCAPFTCTFESDITAVRGLP